ncbi:hypothetical protein ES332_D08G014300v1 [Gossypium tomentosum]|uniref:HMA domain-containing protein n=1 Tax=Gossypium tomentosum TaxID=34277 RepID=A0A5D2JPG9_GOSTO|nr:hypothetical protein ES332_D08G014300v1 [Gossypium tomentosum]
MHTYIHMYHYINGILASSIIFIPHFIIFILYILSLGVSRRKKKSNMKQKVVLKVAMKCQKCRTRSLEVAAEQQGVSFVGLEGNEKEKVVVIGDGIDVVKLATILRKKVGTTEIIRNNFFLKIF